MKQNLLNVFLLAVLTFMLINNITGEDKSKFIEENPKIDFKEYMKNAALAEEHRSQRRLTEQGFIDKSKENKVIILDARSKDKFDLLHIKGAINIPFADISIESLARLLPDKNTTILIYCNNNFKGNERVFASKRASASLNISTYIALYTYGYRNIYELGPLLDVKNTKIELVAEKK